MLGKKDLISFQSAQLIYKHDHMVYSYAHAYKQTIDFTKCDVTYSIWVT